MSASLATLIDDQFEAQGFASRPSSVESILGGRLPRPGILDVGVSTAELMHPLEIGYDQWGHGLWADAEKTITPAFQRINRNPALLVTDTRNLDTIFRGYAALALSQEKLGKTQESNASMTELIRIFRSRPPSRTEFGPPGEVLYYRAYRPLEAAGSGSLFISTGNSHAIVYVDNQIRGIGKAEVSDLIPGFHHVLIQVPSTAGLHYVVEIKAHEGTTLDVDWDVETSLSVTPHWIGYVLANEAERNSEAAYAGALAGRWGTRGVLVVLTTYEIQGRLALLGTLYRVGGAVLRTGAATLEGDLADQVRKLALYLSDGTVSPGVKVIAQPKEAPAAIASSWRAPGDSTLPGLLVTGAGALTVATAAIVYVTSKADDFKHDKRTPAVKFMSGGSAVLGAGVFLYLRESYGTRYFTAASLGAGVGCLMSGTALYLTREAPLGLRPTYRPTGPLGLTLGISGVVLTGAGLWLWHRERDERATAESGARRNAARSAPVVSLDGSHTLVGWAGTF